MENYQKYERIIYKDVEESLSKIANLISSRSIVLDIGCGSGMLGRFLIREKGCIVDGVDGNSAALEICQSTYRFTAVKNLEADLLSDVFQIQVYDYIVVADVLEHLTNPDQLLSELKKLIKPQGTIIFSVPNITHISVALDLLLGRFEYTENGLLDETHLRFYTRQSLLRKLESFGLHVWEIDTVEKAISETEFSSQISKLFPWHWIDALTAYREDSLTYQWLISTKIYSPDTQSQRDIQYPLVRKPSLLFTSELYWADEKNPDLTDDKKLIGHSFQDENLTSIDFLFSEANGANGLSRIRIDPVSDQKPFLIVNAEIRSQQNDVIWTWNPKAVDHEFYDAKLIANVGTVGSLFQAISDDPQWHPTINKEILSRITAGWIFRLILRTDDALISLFNSASLNDGLLAREKQIADMLKQTVVELKQTVVERDTRLRLIENSLSWTATQPLRKAFGSPSSLGRVIRLVVKLVKWTIPLQLPTKSRERWLLKHVGRNKNAQNSTPLHSLRTNLENGLVFNSTILFDHNGGGGSNAYSQELVKQILADGAQVLRVYCYAGVWFVQWCRNKVDLLFFTSSIEELFEVLGLSQSANIIINSIYGYPDIKAAIENIVSIVKEQSATLDLKIHDFYALCPSPHLSDFEEKFCGVPKDIEICITPGIPRKIDPLI
jgi:2-polyprenyl-3-methyl-5-hydroxy-6-metoxy-1,4-benzoquinol methylase